MKIKKFFVISIVSVLLFILLFFAGKYLLFGFYEPSCQEIAFGKEIYAELKEGYSQKDKKELEPVMEDITEALNFIGTQKEIKKKFGKLSRYCIDSKFYSNTVKIKSKVKFVTAKLYNDTGYLWINYTQTGYSKKGKLTMGSADVNSRITLVKFDDVWTPVKIMEAT